MKLTLRIFLFFSSWLVIGLSNQFIVPDMQTDIQSAIDAAVGGDTILVYPGTYFENLTVSGKNIVLGSLFLTTGDSTYIDSTIIDGNYEGSVIVFDSFVNAGAQLSGFTLTHGSGTFTCTGSVAEGGGIYCSQASPRLNDLIIKDNQIITADTLVSRGGGIACNMASPLISNVSIFNNSHSGIYLSDYSSPSLMNVEILDNDAEGIVCSFSANPELNRVLVAANGSTGIKCLNNSSPVLIDVTVADNPGYGISANNSMITLVNAILWGNSPQQLYIYGGGHAEIGYTDILDGENGIHTMNGSYMLGEGMIEVDPQFIDPEYGNYALEISSGCIDMGTDYYEIDGEVLVDLSPNEFFGNFPDAGSFEFGTLPGLQGDVNYDGSLNVVDVVTLVGAIVESNPTNYQLWAGDLNNDDTLNVVDIVALVNAIL